jgi:quercetin dioxygenase-like cupin family protein
VSTAAGRTRGNRAWVTSDTRSYPPGVSDFTEPAIGRRAEATAYRFLDTLSYVRVPGSATDGRVSVVEMHLRAGHAPPMHVHDDADETIHVLDGGVTVHTADDARSLTAGDSVVLPRGEEHSLVADEQSVILASTAPAGFGEFVTAVGEPTEEGTVPTTPPSEDAIGQVNALAGDHGIEIVGPPPAGP